MSASEISGSQQTHSENNKPTNKRAPKRKSQKKAKLESTTETDGAVQIEASPEQAPSPADTTEPRTGGEGPDPFDMNSLRTPAEFIQVKRNVLKVRAGTRAPKDKFMRIMPYDATHGAEVNCLNVLHFEYQFEGELSSDSFLVRPNTDVYELLHDRLRPALIVLGMTRGGSQFFWELKLPSGDRRSDDWALTRLEIAKRGQTQWVKPVADISAGGYNYDAPKVDLPEPDWTDVDFQQLFKIAYRERLISTVEHPAVKEALGL